MSSGSEAFSRVLIDRALTDSGWDLLNPRQVRFEQRGFESMLAKVFAGKL